MNLFEFDQRLAENLRGYSSEGRDLLIRIFSLPAAERARAIGQLHRETDVSSLAELMIDLGELGAEGEQLRAWVMSF